MQTKFPVHTLLLTQQFDAILPYIKAHTPDLNLLDEEGRSPFMIAIKLGIVAIGIMEALITKENFHLADVSQATPMMMAAALRRIDVAKLILQEYAKQQDLSTLDFSCLTDTQLAGLHAFINQQHPENCKSLGHYALLRHGAPEELSKDKRNQLTVINILQTVGAQWNANVIWLKHMQPHSSIIMQQSKGMLLFLRSCGLDVSLKQKIGNKTIKDYLHGLCEASPFIVKDDKDYLQPLIMEFGEKPMRNQASGYLMAGKTNLSNEHDFLVVTRAIGSVPRADINSQRIVRFKPEKTVMIFQDECIYVRRDGTLPTQPEFIATRGLSECYFIHIYNDAGDNLVMQYSLQKRLNLGKMFSQFKDPNQIKINLYGGNFEKRSNYTISTFIQTVQEYWRSNPQCRITFVKSRIMKDQIFQDQTYDHESLLAWLQERFADLRASAGLATTPSIKLNFDYPGNNFKEPCEPRDRQVMHFIATLLFESFENINPARKALFVQPEFVNRLEKAIFTKEGFANCIEIMKAFRHNQVNKVRLNRCAVKLDTRELTIVGMYYDHDLRYLALARMIDSTNQNIDLTQRTSSGEHCVDHMPFSAEFIDTMTKHRSVFVKFRRDVESRFAKDFTKLSFNELVQHTNASILINAEMHPIEAWARVCSDLQIDACDNSLFYPVLHVSDLLEAKPELFMSDSRVPSLRFC
ncbi:MAG: ankyrin repeat domain-containing protein [Pseudomonadota bacterium]|nr:ankyrin repeat domain-containing protein [Pseudomonadota bacterium]